MTAFCVFKQSQYGEPRHAPQELGERFATLQAILHQSVKCDQAVQGYANTDRI